MSAKDCTTSTNPPRTEAAAPVCMRRRLGAAFLGLIVLAGVAYCGQELALRIRDEVRKAYVFAPAKGAVTRYLPPMPYQDSQFRPQTAPAQIFYRYHVDGRPYAGRYVQRPLLPVPNDFDASLDVAFSRGDPLTVYYDPAAPGQSTLVPLAQPRLIAPAMVLVALAAVGIWLVASGVRRRRVLARPALPDPAALSAGGAFAKAYLALSVILAAAFYASTYYLAIDAATLLGVGLAAVVAPLAAALASAMRLDHLRKRAIADREILQSPLMQFVGHSHQALARPGGLLAGVALLALLWSAAVGGAVLWAARGTIEHWRQRSSLATSQGFVVATDVRPVQRDANTAARSAAYEPIVRFFFKIGQDEYAGQQYAAGPTECPTYAQAKAIVDAYPEGAPVTVFYPPDAPSAAFLDPRLPPSHHLLLVAMAPAVLVAAGLWISLVWLVAWIRRCRLFSTQPMDMPWRIPCWGVMRQEAAVLWIQRRTTPMIAAIACFTAVDFAIVGIVEATGGSESFSPWAAAYSLAACLCAAILAAAVLVGQGPRSLQLDRDACTITLTRRREDRELAFADVAAWTLSWQLASRGVLTPRKLTAVLGLRTKSDGELAVHRFRSAWPCPHIACIARTVAEELAAITESPVEIRPLAM